jgi:beta-N-acetylhexosaminidase
MRHGIAFVRGLQEQHVLACAKHFPGHGDTALDSHVDLPHVDADGARLSYVELPPFRAASGAGVASMMSAHVVYRALDEDVPATFSRAILTNLLRREIGFEGVLFSDDLEMGAIEKHHAIDHAAPAAVWAGCDVLLICHDQDKQDAALEALVARAARDDFFRKRCEEAAQRVARIRQLCPPKPAEPSRLGALVGGRDSRLITDEIAARLAAREASEEKQGS